MIRISALIVLCFWLVAGACDDGMPWCNETSSVWCKEVPVISLPLCSSLSRCVQDGICSNCRLLLPAPICGPNVTGLCQYAARIEKAVDVFAEVVHQRDWSMDIQVVIGLFVLSFGVVVAGNSLVRLFLALVRMRERLRGIPAIIVFFWSMWVLPFIFGLLFPPYAVLYVIEQHCTGGVWLVPWLIMRFHIPTIAMALLAVVFWARNFRTNYAYIRFRMAAAGYAADVAAAVPERGRRIVDARNAHRAYEDEAVNFPWAFPITAIRTTLATCVALGFLRHDDYVGASLAISSCVSQVVCYHVFLVLCDRFFANFATHLEARRAQAPQFVREGYRYPERAKHGKFTIAHRLAGGLDEAPTTAAQEDAMSITGSRIVGDLRGLGLESRRQCHKFQAPLIDGHVYFPYNGLLVFEAAQWRKVREHKAHDVIVYQIIEEEVEFEAKGKTKRTDRGRFKNLYGKRDTVPEKRRVRQFVYYDPDDGSPMAYSIFDNETGEWGDLMHPETDQRVYVYTHAFDDGYYWDYADPSTVSSVYTPFDVRRGVQLPICCLGYGEGNYDNDLIDSEPDDDVDDKAFEAMATTSVAISKPETGHVVARNEKHKENCRCTMCVVPTAPLEAYNSGNPPFRNARQAVVFADTQCREPICHGFNVNNFFVTTGHGFQERLDANPGARFFVRTDTNAAPVELTNRIKESRKFGDLWCIPAQIPGLKGVQIDSLAEAREGDRILLRSVLTDSSTTGTVIRINSPIDGTADATHNLSTSEGDCGCAILSSRGVVGVHRRDRGFIPISEEMVKFFREPRATMESIAVTRTARGEVPKQINTQRALPRVFARRGRRNSLPTPASN